MSHKLELISFNLCPFVQRSVITLLEKKIDHKVTYINLANPPAWFLEISPLAKVPVLKVDDSVLFESAIINEYLDKITPPQIQPTDPLEEAKNRAWIEFISEMIVDHYHLTTTKSEDDFEKHQQALNEKFTHLEKVLTLPPFFNGEKISLVDTAIAPLFMRLELYEEKAPLHLYATDSKISTWCTTLLSRPSVQQSVVDNFENLLRSYFQSTGGVYAKRLGLS